MCFAIRDQTLQTGFGGFELFASAAVTWHLSRFDWDIVVSLYTLFLELLHDLPEPCVDAQFEAFAELFVAQWTQTLVFALPVPGDTGLAEVVSTWNRNRLDEEIHADGARELIFRQQTIGRGHF